MCLFSLDNRWFVPCTCRCMSPGMEKVARNSPPRSSQATRLSAVGAPPVSLLPFGLPKLEAEWMQCQAVSMSERFERVDTMRQSFHKAPNHHPDSNPPTAALVGSMSCFSCFSPHPPMRITNSPFLSWNLSNWITSQYLASIYFDCFCFLPKTSHGTSWEHMGKHLVWAIALHTEALIVRVHLHLFQDVTNSACETNQAKWDTGTKPQRCSEPVSVCSCTNL